MANPEHLEILKQGAEKWNEWRATQIILTPDLIGVNLHDASLVGANLMGAALNNSDLTCTLAAILRQLMAKGLIEPQLILRQHGDKGRTYTSPVRSWVLTAIGKAKYLEKRAILSDEG